MSDAQDAGTADISLLDDFHGVLKACGRLGADSLAVIEEELGIHKTKLAAKADSPVATPSEQEPSAEGQNSDPTAHNGKPD
jgi:hypothetical protein